MELHDHVQGFSSEQDRSKTWAIENALEDAAKGVKDSIMDQYDASLRLYAAEAFDRGMDVRKAVRDSLQRILERKKAYGRRRSSIPPICGEKRRNTRAPGSNNHY